MRYRPSKAIFDELINVLRSGADGYGATISSLEELGDRIVSPRVIESMIERTLDPNKVRSFSKVLFYLAGQRWSMNLDLDELLEGVDAQVSKLDDEISKEWPKFRNLLERALQLNVISSAVKLMGLAFDYRNLMLETRVITDFRPVFDNERENIVAGLVSQVLRIDYRKDKETVSVSIMLDDNDLLELISNCERALEKGQELKKLTSDKGQIDTFIIGEELYGTAE